MAMTINGFTWDIGESDYGLHCSANSSNDIGLMCYLNTEAGWGSSFLFFDLDYVPQNNGKLKISVNGVTATNEQRPHYSWNAIGTIKANGITIFSGTLTSSDTTTVHTGGTLCALTGGTTTSGVIDYNADSQGSLSITYECSFDITYVIQMVYPAGSVDGWTTYGTITADAKSITYSHTHTLTTTTTLSPTCTTTGLSLTSCSTCDYNYTESIAMLGHTWDNGVITTPSTYESTGIKTHTCSVCNGTKEEELAKLIVSVYIDNGESLDEYSIYIDDGEEWHPYILYIDDGEKFVAYC